MDPTWQNFYLLTGTAAATLIGLMFVAVTFGATLVTVEVFDTTRSFVDPPFTNFVQVLVTACLMVVPSMSPSVLGGLLLAIGALRMAALVRIYRHMRDAHRKNNDIELSDWVSGIIVPLFTHLGLIGVGVGLLMGRSVLGFLAAATIVVLLNGIYGAWELLLWLALTRSRAKRDQS